MQHPARVVHDAVARSEVPIPVMVLLVVEMVFHVTGCPREDQALCEIDPSASLSFGSGQMAVLGFCTASADVEFRILITIF